MMTSEAVTWAVALLAAALGWKTGPGIAWAIRAWPGHESFHGDYLQCHACAGGLRRGCYNAGRTQDSLYAAFAALVAAASILAYGPGVRAAVSWLFAVSCLIIAVVDYRYYIIPDLLSVHGCWTGLAWHGAVALALRADALASPPSFYVPVLDSLFGFLLGFGFLAMLSWLALFLLKKEGMGWGDVKLLGAMGAWMGWQAVIATIVLASFAGSVVGVSTILYRRLRYGTEYKPLAHMIPFGPYLCLGFLFVFYLGMDPLYRVMAAYQAWVEARLGLPH